MSCGITTRSGGDEGVVGGGDILPEVFAQVELVAGQLEEQGLCFSMRLKPVIHPHHQGASAEVGLLPHGGLDALT